MKNPMAENYRNERKFVKKAGVWNQRLFVNLYPSCFQRYKEDHALPYIQFVGKYLGPYRENC